MKVIWEEDDIEGGLVVKKTASRELFMTAYYPEHGNSYLVSLADGLIMAIGLNKQAAAAHLNAHDYQPFNQIRTCRTVADCLTDTRHT
jgi:hypothetical protein